MDTTSQTVFPIMKSNWEYANFSTTHHHLAETIHQYTIYGCTSFCLTFWTNMVIIFFFLLSFFFLFYSQVVCNRKPKRKFFSKMREKLSLNRFRFFFHVHILEIFKWINHLKKKKKILPHTVQTHYQRPLVFWNHYKLNNSYRQSNST